MRYNDNKYENGMVLDLHEQYYWLSSHRNMIEYSLYSLNARPPPKCTPEARSRHCIPDIIIIFPLLLYQVICNFIGRSSINQ